MILLALVLALQDWTPPPVSELSFDEAYACHVLSLSAREIEFPAAQTPQTANEQSLWDDLTRLHAEAGAAADAAALREQTPDRDIAESLVRENLIAAGNEQSMQVLVRCMMVFGMG